MLIDANLLLYAVGERSLHHRRARNWLVESMIGPRRVGLPWLSLAAFLRISTNPRRTGAPRSGPGCPSSTSSRRDLPHLPKPRRNRVAGNVEDVNLVGSLEFATRVAGSKAIVILGHSACGAIKGAADGVELGNLTELLKAFDAPIARADAATDGEASSSNIAFLNLAIEENVRETIANTLDQSPVIAEMVDNGDIVIADGVYDLASGRVTWLDS